MQMLYNRTGQVATQKITQPAQVTTQYCSKDLKPTIFQQKDVLSFLDSNFKHDGPGTKFPAEKTKPKYRGYNRSGMLLFNNINQKNVADAITPRVTGTLQYVKKCQSEKRSQSMGNTGQSFGQTAQSSQSQSSNNSNYQVWQSHNILNNGKQLKETFNKIPIKQSVEVQNKMDQIERHSPEYNLKKINNYDNTIKNSTRQVFENFNLMPNYEKTDKSFSNFSQTESKKFTIPSSETLNLGSSAGKGGRAFLYASYKKRDNQSMDKTSNMKASTSKIDFKRTQTEFVNKWNHFDSNINNAIVEQRKIINCKNYELDSRAWGLKDYGYQPKFGNELKKHRDIDEILFNQTHGKEPEKRLPAYKKHFTPITTYCKSLHDAKVTDQYGPAFSAFRSNLNFS